MAALAELEHAVVRVAEAIEEFARGEIGEGLDGNRDWHFVRLADEPHIELERERRRAIDPETPAINAIPWSPFSQQRFDWTTTAVEPLMPIPLLPHWLTALFSTTTFCEPLRT